MFQLTQSGIKSIWLWNPDDEQYERKDSVCPKRWKENFIDKTMPNLCTQAQAMGVYFEYGINVNPDAEIKDLPLKGKNVKTVAHERLDQQMGVFRGLCKKMNIKLDNTQVKMYYEWISCRVVLKSTLDIFDVIDGVPTNIDVKVCGNMKSDFGPYQWAEPEKKDWLQSKFYDYIYFKKYGVHMKHIYLVFDYSPKMNFNDIYYEVSKEDHNQVDYLVTETLNLIAEWHRMNYPVNPSVSDCRACPFGSKKLNKTELLLHPKYTMFGDGSCEHYIDKEP